MSAEPMIEFRWVADSADNVEVWTHGEPLFIVSIGELDAAWARLDGER